MAAAGEAYDIGQNGNRSNTSVSGSADVLETAAGVNLRLTPEQWPAVLNSWGRVYVRRLILRHETRDRPRKELGLRTIFNPRPHDQSCGGEAPSPGVYSRALCSPLAQVLGRLGCEHVLVVHADDGLDEISLAYPCGRSGGGAP